MIIVWWVEWAGDYYFTLDYFAAKTKWHVQNNCGYPATIYCTKEEWCEDIPATTQEDVFIENVATYLHNIFGF